MAKIQVSKEQRNVVRNARKMIDQLMEMNGNEAETRRRVERIFEEVMGYDALKHLSRERAVKGAGETEHVDFAIQLRSDPDVQPAVMIELKRVGIDLSKKHLKQIVSYSIDAGCEWILLTNSREWKIYHVEFGQPPKVEMLEKWNLLEDDIDEVARKFELMSYKFLKRGGLNNIWQRVKVLAPSSLLSALIAENTLRIVRSNLRKNTGVLVDNEEVYTGISKLLNEAAGLAMSNIKMPRSTRRIGKRKTKEEEGQAEDVVPREEKEEATSEQQGSES